jgi:hypothetical protein
MNDSHACVIPNEAAVYEKALGMTQVQTIELLPILNECELFSADCRLR